MTTTNKAKWTFMVYLAGDNNLSDAGENDLNEMRAVGSTADVNIVAQFDRIGDNHDTKRYHIRRGGENERVESLGETDSGDPSVLLDFVKWTVGNYPAERYVLVLWNHGCGWEPLDLDKIARAVNAKNYNAREAGERAASPMGRAFFRTTWEQIFRLPSPADRAICTDDGSGHSLDTIELGNVLTTVKELLNQPLDILGMDACLMSNLEVAYQAEPYVRYIVASEENEPAEGWPYTAVLRKLVENPELTTADFAAHIVDTYVASYVNKHYPGPVTQSALDLAKVDVLAKPLDALADALIPCMNTAKHQIGEALYQTSASFWYGTLWDVAHFCEKLAAETDSDAVRTAAQAVKAALQPQCDSFVIRERHEGAKVERCGGVTVYLPPRILHKVSCYYGDLAYAKNHRWATMLNTYHDV